MIPVFVVALIVAGAAIPYGGVAPWARTLLGLLCFGAAIYGAIALPPPPRRNRRLAVSGIGTVLLTGWIGFHAVLRHRGVIVVPEAGYGSAVPAGVFLWAAYGLFGWWASRICERRGTLKGVAAAVIAMGTAEALFGIVALYSDIAPYARFVSGNRAAGTFSSGNSFGGFLAVTLVLSFGAAIVLVSRAVEHIKRRGIRILHVATPDDYIVLGAVAIGAACLTQVAALLLSGSRGGIVSAAAMLLSLLLWFAVHSQRRSEPRHTIAFGLVLLVVVLALGGGGAFGIATSRMREMSTPDAAVLPRLLIWKTAWGLVRMYPLGTGLGTFADVFPAFQPAGYSVSRIYHAHNDYLELLVEIGIPGMLLLGVVLGSLIIPAGKRVLHANPVNECTWLRRGALLAVCASLIHAAVDFNLSSRPGVAVLVVAMLGMAISQSRGARPMMRPPLTTRFVRVAVLMLVLAPLAVLQLREAAASILARQGFAALGGSPSPYFFLPLSSLAPDTALARMERAASLAPRNAWARVMLARGRQLRHDIQREVMVRKHNRPGTPIHLLNMQLAVALRPEERSMLQQACGDLASALQMAPDSLDASAQMALVLGRLAHLADHEAVYRETVARLLTQTEHARSLGPHDLASKRLVFRGLVHATQSTFGGSLPEERARLQSRIRDQGVALMRLSSQPVSEVLEGFAYAAIEPAAILTERELHLDVLWKTYRHYDRLGDGATALATLDALSKAIGDATLSRSRFRPERGLPAKERYRTLALRERCRWLLRTQQFAAYAALQPERAASPRQSVARQQAVFPDHAVGMQFLGGQAELTGISVTPDKVTTYWRFRSSVPSDLQAVVFLTDDAPTKRQWRAVDFNQAGGLDFGRGIPRIGRVITIETPVSHKQVSMCSRLCVGLRRKSTRQWLHSSEDLPFLEIDNWFDLVYDCHRLKDQVAPDRDVRKALGMDEFYRAPRFSHNMVSIFDTSEFRPLLDGTRKTTQPPTWQPCLAASGIVERAVAAARKAFDSDPHEHMFALGINDGQDWCECDACRVLCPPDEQGKPASRRWWSEPYWTLVNSVANELQKTHPDRRIGAIAYSNVARPPTFKLADNVTVYVCQDAGAHFDPKSRERDYDRLQAWLEVCSDVGLYGYAGLSSWIFPRYCRDELTASIRTASKLGINKFYLERSWVEWVDGPLPWIVKEILEDPTADPKVLQRQFCNTAYGPAAEVMDTYFDYLQRIWQSAPRGRWFDGLFRIDQQARRYPPSVRGRMHGFIGDAEELARDIPAVLRRIRAVARPLEVAEAFAVEYDLMRELARPIEDEQGLLATEANLETLRRAIEGRQAVLASLDDRPWGASVRRALTASRLEPTLDRWTRRQAAFVSDIQSTVTVLRNALRCDTSSEETGHE